MYSLALGEFILILETSIVVHGKVQGVGYRASVLRFVDDNYLQIKGYVKNLPNGTVKIVAQGNKEEISRLRQFASSGSSISQVEHIEEVYREVFSFSYGSFEIDY